MTTSSPPDCASEFTAALIRRDIKAALALLTDDVVFFYSNGSVIRGKDAFAALMTASWKVVQDYQYTTLDSSWVTETDAAASVIYAFEWSGHYGVCGRGRRTAETGGWEQAVDNSSHLRRQASVPGPAVFPRRQGRSPV